MHLQSLGPLRYKATDIANSQDAEGLLIELDPHEFTPLPLSRLRGGIGLWNIPRYGEHHGYGMFGGRHGIFSGGVHHEDSPPRGCLHVDVIYSNSGTSDDLKPLRCVDNISGERCFAPDNDTIVFPDRCP